MAIIYGVNPVLEQLREDSTLIEQLHLLKGPLGGQLGRIARLARENHIRVVFADRKALTRLADGGVHQGVVARIQEYKYADYRAFLDSLGPACTVVILDGVQDPGNLGSIVRTAVCAGVDGVIIPDRNAAGMTAAAIKTSAGAASRAQVVRVSNLTRTIEDLKAKNIWCVAVEAGGEKTIGELEDGLSYAFVFGNEAKGIRRLVKEACDMSARIPMSGDLDSLNVSVAVGVTLFRGAGSARS